MNDQLAALVREGNLSALEQMLREGELADLPAEDKGALPRLAARTGNAALLRLLCECSHAVAIADTDEQGRDVLHYAAMSGDAQTVAYCVDRLGFDPLRGDKNGVTALDLATGGEAARWLHGRVGFAPSDAYRNPVRRGFYPDPSVVRLGEDYYMINSTFVAFPCLPVSHSRDLVHWRTIGHAITRLDWSGIEGMPGGFGYWAPDISYFKGRFWVIATLRRSTAPFRLQMITSAPRPEGPYDRPRFLDIDGIDPSIFTDGDGRRYVVINPGAQIAELSETGELLTAPELLYYGSRRVKTEGPHLLRRGGWYYLFQAEGGTGKGHMETVARSRTLRGVYEPCPFNPVLGRTQADAYIRRSGHGKPLQLADGRWYMLYLCGRDVDGLTMLGRETALDPMTWTADGWPMVNGLKGPGCLNKKPLPDWPCAADDYPQEDFLAPRTDPRSFAAPVEGGWRLRAGGALHGIGGVSALLRRQSERGFVQCVTVDASALHVGGLAGLCGYYDERSHYLFGLRRTAQGYRLAVAEREGDTERERILCDWPGAAATLRVEANGRRRMLKALNENAASGEAAETVLDAAYLSDEGVKDGKRFTGATLGMAAVGGGEAVFTRYQERMVEGDCAV